MALKILLADDSMTAQNMGKKILSDAGYEVLTVSNGAAAMKKVAEIAPDIALLDVYMPGYSGLEVCERMKVTPATARIPVLLTVGKMEPFRPEEGMKAKADGVIIKPFEATDLVTVVDKLASRTYGADAVKAAPAAQVANEPPKAVATNEAIPEPPYKKETAEEDEPAPHFIVDEESEPVLSAAKLESFARKEDVTDKAFSTEPHIEFTAAPHVEVATERISELETTALQDVITADNATELGLDSFASTQHSAFSAQQAGAEDTSPAEAMTSKGSEPVWESVEPESADIDVEVDLDAEMRHAQAQAYAAPDRAPAKDAQVGGEDSEERAMAAGVATGAGVRSLGVPLLAPIGKTSFDEFDSIMAETASRFEASSAGAVQADEEATEAVSLPAVDASEIVAGAAEPTDFELAPEMVEEAAEEVGDVPLDSAVLEQPGSFTDQVETLPELVSEEHEGPVFTEAPHAMKGLDALSGVFELDDAAESGASSVHVEGRDPQPATLAGEGESEPVWASIVPERVDREFVLPPMEGAADSSADTQAANSVSAAEQPGQASPDESTQTAAAGPTVELDEATMNTMVERVVDRVLERLKPVLVVTVEEILKEFKR